jgi:prevent-host-death family protein
MPAAEFKAKCLRILDELEPEGIVITKRGRPVAKVLPAAAVDNHKLIGSMKGKIQIKGDIFSTGVQWNAESRHSHGGSPPRRKPKR